MSWPFWDDLQFVDECFIPFRNAFDYLVDEQAVFELDRLFFYYKGFALENEDDALIFLGREPERMYLEAMSLMSETDARLFFRINCYGHEGHIITDLVNLYIGKINGKEAFRSSENCNTFTLDTQKQINLWNVYVKKSDLDDISKKHGIQKETSWNDNHFDITALDNKNNSEMNDVVIHSVDNSNILIIKYIKSLTISHPNFTAADLRQYCLESIKGLSARDSAVINDFLIRVGAAGPKEIYPDDNSFKSPILERKDNIEIDNAVIDSKDSPQEEIIKFTKSILIQHPKAKTADLRRNCFDDMGNLNSRDGKIINDLLIKAGATKSKQGEHSTDIKWDIKYPRLQWERVFNKKNSRMNSDIDDSF